MLRLRTFGGLSLESDRGPLRGAATQRRRLAVLAIVAEAGAQGVSRDRLIGLLWPEVDETRARSALSQALYALKRDAGEHQIVAGYDRLTLNEKVVAADVTAFHDAIARDDLTAAAELYTGGFLDGVYVDDAPDFEHWLDDVRLRLGRTAERALERLATDAERRGDHADAADWWRRLTALAPLKTGAVLRLMEALAGSGDRAGALRHAERYAQRTREELEVEPSAAVTTLAGRLRGELEEARISDRFVIVRELGRGGSAIVYLARDTKHDRHVALKMLHPELGAAIGRERLAREIRIIARLQHPHILPLHDSGEWADTLYYVMPFVEGESLRARLSRDRQLALDDVLVIGREVADALDHAHRHGIVHGDVKPENILLADGHAVLADFGVARVTSDAMHPADVAVEPSSGTPAYAAPERIAGSGQADAASDLFSLGCVLFETLAGRPPWMARRRRGAAPALKSLRPDTPAWLAELVHQMLSELPSGRPSSASDVSRSLKRGADAPPSLLPLVGDAMVGREKELEAARAALDDTDVTLLTLTGAGGVGKTRLAIQLVRTCVTAYDRVYFVDLSPVRDADGVAPAITAAVGTSLEGDRDPLEALATLCAGRRVLLVLDNFEQVVSAAPILTRLAALAPSLKLLITSRVRLGIAGEHELNIAPLPLPADDATPTVRRENPAVRLFLRRAAEANAALVVDDEVVSAASEICGQLDGLPLAIELAAARCRLLTPRAVAARLAAGFGLLSGGSRHAPGRHQTMRHTVAWSFALLTPEEQRLFVRLAVFAGGCTLAAAEAVCVDPDSALSVIDGLSVLVDASVLVCDAPAGGEPRLRMLATVREFALDVLSSSPEAGAMAQRHADWFRRLAGTLAPRLIGELQNETVALLAAEHANFGAALRCTIDRGDAEASLALGASLWRYWLVRGHLVEGRDWLARMLALPASSDPALEALRADVMTGAGHLAQNSGAVDEATRHFQEVLAIRQRLGDRAGAARALADLGWICWRRCDYPEARRLSAECLAMAEALGETRVAALALTNLGTTALFEGNLEEACDLLGRSARLRNDIADQRGVAFVNSILAWALCRKGTHDAARTLLEAAETTLRAAGDRRLVYFARDVLAEIHLREGDPERSAAILEIDSISGVRRFGDRWSVAHGLALASWTSRLLGRLDQSDAFAEESLDLRRAEQDRYGEAECLALLASTAGMRGNRARAAELMQQSRDIRSSIGDLAGVAECQAELSRLEVTT